MRMEYILCLFLRRASAQRPNTRMHTHAQMHKWEEIAAA